MNFWGLLLFFFPLSALASFSFCLFSVISEDNRTVSYRFFICSFTGMSGAALISFNTSDGVRGGFKDPVLGVASKLLRILFRIKISQIIGWSLKYIRINFFTSLSCAWISVHERFQPVISSQFFFIAEFMLKVKHQSKSICNRMDSSPIWSTSHLFQFFDVYNYILFHFHSRHAAWNQKRAECL